MVLQNLIVLTWEHFLISMVQLNFQGILSAFFAFDLPGESRPLIVAPASLGVL